MTERSSDVSASEDIAAQSSETKAVDAGLVLPLAGLALLSPPVISLFAVDGRVFGAPSIITYLFFVWAALIFFAWRLSRRLTALTEAERDTG